MLWGRLFSFISVMVLSGLTVRTAVPRPSVSRTPARGSRNLQCRCSGNSPDAGGVQDGKNTGRSPWRPARVPYCPLRAGRLISCCPLVDANFHRV